MTHTKTRWKVLWGGREAGKNHHVYYSDQRFGVDLVAIRRTEKQNPSGKKDNEDHLCFGQPVFAPSDGKVSDLVNDLEDHPPGSPGANGSVSSRAGANPAIERSPCTR